jgi:hypothetical protein
MSLFPTDWISFIWGAVAGGVVAFMGGFLKKAGEHVFTVVSNKFNPRPLEPIQVGGQFVPVRYEGGVCAWVREVNLYDYEEKGYNYYPHPKGGAKCFRISSSGRDPVKEFLMVEPDAKELPAT